MRKLSKKERKIAKENVQRREKQMLKAGVPYSKHRKRVCFHYGWSGGMGCKVQSFPWIIERGNGEYICMECGKVFTQKEKEQLEKLCFYLETSPVRSRETVESLSKGVEPVEYYYKDRNEIVRCGKADVLPGIAGVWIQ